MDTFTVVLIATMGFMIVVWPAALLFVWSKPHSNNFYENAFVAFSVSGLFALFILPFVTFFHVSGMHRHNTAVAAIAKYYGVKVTALSVLDDTVTFTLDNKSCTADYKHTNRVYTIDTSTVACTTPQDLKAQLKQTVDSK